MKTKKSIIGLIFSVSMLIGVNSLKNTTHANIGWAVAELCDASPDATAGAIITTGIAGGGAVAAAIAGAEIGAKLGFWGGIGGIAAGAVIGGL